MQFTLPSGNIVDEPDENKIVETVNNMDPNRPENLRLARSDEDWVEVQIMAKGLKMRCKDPSTGLTLQSTGPYLSKANVIVILKAYLNDSPKWNMHVSWAPEGAGGGAKKKGCMGVLLLFGVSLSLLCLGAVLGLS